MNTRQIAHEIKNQLSIIDIYANILEKKTNEIEAIEVIKKSIASIKSLVEEIKDSNESLKSEQKTLDEVIKKSAFVYKEIFKEKNNKLKIINEAQNTKVQIDENKFLIAINNILKNAHEATSDDEIQIKISKKDTKVKIEFINHGEKIKETNQKRIFETGFTTKNSQSENGWGVGLGACLEIIKSQNGELKLAKSDENETIFEITMPLV